MRTDPEETTMDVISALSQHLHVDAPSLVKDLQRHLAVEAATIDAWLRDRPDWMTELAVDPQGAIDALLRHTGWEGGAVSVIPPAAWRPVLKPERRRAPGTDLLIALWQWANQDRTHYDQLVDSPFQAIQSVADRGNFAPDVVASVMDAYRAELGIISILPATVERFTDIAQSRPDFIAIAPIRP